jgi:hypothetical protein
VSDFEDAESLRIVLKISTRSLYLGAYSKTQQWLFERVKTLRVEEKLTFPQIAEHLTKFGIRSTRGKKLSAEHVFSILNKGLVKEANQMTNAVVTVAEISLIKTLS